MKPIEQLHETETWVFDLDNTLYPASCGLMAAVSSRMTEFVSDVLRLEPDAALIEQKRGPHIEQKCATLAPSCGSVSSW